MRRLLPFAMLLAASLAHAQTPRLADEFERAALETQLARERDPIAAAAAWINLGDLDASRAEVSSARARYETAHKVAAAYRLRARRSSHLTDFATASAYTALAAAKLGRRAEAFALLEESIRYLSDSAKIWNLYASSMMVLGESRKAASAARNAVEIASRTASDSPSASHELDRNIYRYALASTLSATEPVEAERTLETILDALGGPQFEPLRREIARREAFEVFTSTKSDAEAYLALHTQTGLRLGKLYAARGATAEARAAYERVLALRSDEPAALAGLARLAETAEQKRRWFAASFEANPFSLDLIRDYERFIATEGDADPGTATIDARLRRGIQLLARRQKRQALALFEGLRREHPQNATLRILVERASAKDAVRPSFLTTAERQVIVPTEGELRTVGEILRDGEATPAERQRLDALRFTSRVAFDSAVAAGGVTRIESGSIGAVRFRFAEPVSFHGDFENAPALALEYRILGVSESGGAEALLLEPIRVVRE